MTEEEKGSIFESKAEEKEDYLEPEKTQDVTKQEMQQGEKEIDTTTEQGREELIEEDEISPTEEGFAEGAEDKGELGTCAHCDKPLSQDPKEIVEREIDSEKFWFCCDKCAEAGPKKE